MRIHKQTVTVEIDLDIEAEIDPAERMTHNYPGCEAEATIYSISISGHEIPIETFDIKQIKELEAEMLYAFQQKEIDRAEAARDNWVDHQIDKMKESR